MERYTGGTIEGFFFVSDKITETVTVGEAHTWQGVMFSSVSQTNGPVVLSVKNARFGELSCASIDSNGVLRAVNPGKVIISGKFNRDAQNSQSIYQRDFYQWVMLPKCEMFVRNQTDTHQYLQVGDDYAPNFNEENAKIEGQKFIAGRHQKWVIAPTEGTPYYKIQNKASEMVLTVPDGKSTTENVQLIQTTYTGSENQQWEIDNVRTGRYIIRPRLSPENLCVATSDWDKQILQRRCVTDNGSYREEWNFEDANAVRATKYIKFYYDNQTIKNIEDVSSIDDLREFLQETMNIFKDNFNLEFKIQLVEYSETLDWYPGFPGCSSTNYDDVCDTRCGHFTDCARDHHKSASRLLNNSLSEDDVYVCRMVSYRLCWFTEGVHDCSLWGLGTVGGKNSIVTNNKNNTQIGIQGTILHELTHNLGCDHCSDPKCYIHRQTGSSIYWCNNDDLKIRKIIYG